MHTIVYPLLELCIAGHTITVIMDACSGKSFITRKTVHLLNLPIERATQHHQISGFAGSKVSIEETCHLKIFDEIDIELLIVDFISEDIPPVETDITLDWESLEGRTLTSPFPRTTKPAMILIGLSDIPKIIKSTESTSCIFHPEHDLYAINT